MSDEFEREMSERARAYVAWRDDVLAKVREAVETAESGWFAELHTRILDRVELVLTASFDQKDERGLLVSDPIARHHARAMLVDLALAYGIAVGDSMPPVIARTYEIDEES